jgi:hypothetical protein
MRPDHRGNPSDRRADASGRRAAGRRWTRIGEAIKRALGNFVGAGSRRSGERDTDPGRQ